MELIPVSEQQGLRDVPKAFLTMIKIPDGPFKGQFAHPCICGYHTDIDDVDVIFQYSPNGNFRYVHNYCVQED